ncbi:MAG: hypothetical protein L3J50_05525, partial [Emcibacter sp.]|nr:hypothetical protein [Emcibacter sp.]
QEARKKEIPAQENKKRPQPNKETPPKENKNRTQPKKEQPQSKKDQKGRDPRKESTPDKTPPRNTHGQKQIAFGQSDQVPAFLLRNEPKEK